MVRILKRVAAADGSGKEYIEAAALSTDSKPTDGIITGSVIDEVDTGKRFEFDETGEAWVEQPAKGGGGGGEIVLPDGYTQVMFVNVTSGQGFDTGVKVTRDTRVKVAFEGNFGNLNTVIGSTAMGILLAAKNAKIEAYFGEKSVTKNGGTYEFRNAVVVVDISKNGVILNDEDLAWSGEVPTIAGNYNVVPFVSGFDLSNQTNAFIGRCYVLKVWDGDELVRHLIPAVRNADSVCGLYDVVNGQFYVSGGTGNWTAGPDIENVA